MGEPLKKLAIIRGSSYKLDPAYYDIQEIGLAKALSLYGFSVDIFMTLKGVKHHLINISDRIRVFNLNYINLPRYRGLSFEIMKYIFKNGYDFIQCHEHSQPMTLLACLLNRVKAKKSKLILYQGIYRAPTGLKKFFNRIYEKITVKFLIKDIDIILAKTYRAKVYLKKLGFKNINVVPPGISEFEVSLIKDGRVIKEKMKPCFITTVSYPFHNRNPFFTIKLFKYLKTNFPDGILILAGSDSKLLRDYIKTLKVSNCFIYGNILHKRFLSLLMQANLLIFPTSYEIFGLVQAEALSCGLPVLALPNPGAIELIRSLNQQGIYLLNTLSLKKWCDKILKVLESRELPSLIYENRFRLYWPYIVDNFYLKAIGV